MEPKSNIIKKPYKRYNSEAIKLALNEINSDKISIYATAKKYHIPKSTLQDFILNNNKKKAGSPQIISIESERKIADWIKECARKGDPRTKEELFQAAIQYDIYENRPPRFGSKGPSEKWLKSFMLRHKSISFRKPEMISKAAATVCEEDIDNFFTKFENWLKEEELTDILNKPERFFNLDETCFDLNSPPQRVLAEKGSKTVYVVNGSKIHDNITATFCFSASGDVLPPQIIFNKAFSKIEDVSYAAGELRTKFLFSQTEKGWQNKESFKNYIEKLDEELSNRKIERPVIFFFDGHASHTNIDLYLWCKERKIILVVFPPNATHLLQMCDTTIFAPTKKRWRSEVNDYKKEFKKIDIDHVDFIKILSRVMKKTMTPESIRNGFRGTGIFPLNRNNIHRDRIIGTLPTHALSTLPQIVHNEENEIMEIDGNEENSIYASYHSEAFDSNDMFVEQGPSTTIKITNENSSIPLLDCNQLTEREKKLINEMKQLNNQLMDSLKHKNSQHYLSSLIISQQLNLIDPTNNFSPFNVSHIVKEETKEPILPAPATFSRKGLSRRKKIMNGVMTSDEIIEMHLAEMREKERLQKEKDDRKLIREQRKLIKENTMQIKLELEKTNECQNVVPPKKRGRKPKSVPQKV